MRPWSHNCAFGKSANNENKSRVTKTIVQYVHGKKMATQNNTIGMLAHLLGIFTGFIGPLVIFLTMNEKSGSNYENSRNALNFQLSMLIYGIVSGILVLVLIGIVLLWALSIFSLVTCIIGTIKASRGEVYKYPLAISFIK